MNKHSYYLIYWESPKAHKVSFNIGGDSKESALITLQGKNIKRVFINTVRLLSRYGGIIPVETSDHKKIYTIREDLGPLIGTYILLLRRARNYDKWHRFLERILNEEFPGVATVLTSFLETAIELSKTWAETGKAFDIVSSTLKHFVNSLEKNFSNSLQRDLESKRYP